MQFILLLFSFLIISKLAPELTSYNYKRVIETLILVVAATQLLFIKRLSVNRALSIIALPGLIALTASVFFTSYRLIELTTALLPLALCILFLFAYHKFDPYQSFSYAKWLFFYSIISVLPLVLSTAFYTTDPKQASDYYVIFSNWENRRFFNQVQVMLIPAALYFISDKKLSNIAFLVLTINLFFLLLSDGRGALLTTMIVIFLYLHHDSSSRAKVTKSILVSVVVFILFWWMYSDSSSKLVSFSSSGRIEMWLYTLSTFDGVTEWLFGQGSMTFNFRGVLEHPHNSLLQVLYGWGTLGAISVAIPILYILVGAASVQTKLNSSELVLFLSFFAGLFYSMFSGVLVMPASQTLFTILFAINLKLFESKQRVAVSPLRISKVIIIVVTSLYIYTCIASYCHYIDNRSSYGGPHFWSF